MTQPDPPVQVTQPDPTQDQREILDPSHPTWPDPSYIGLENLLKIVQCQ